jgi:hypothetical protein
VRRGGPRRPVRVAIIGSGLGGLAAPSFLNFFIVYGPNTNGGGSIIHQPERQAEVAANAVRRLQEGPVFGRTVRSVDTKADAHRRWTTWVDRRLVTTTSAGRAPLNHA